MIWKKAQFALPELGKPRARQGKIAICEPCKASDWVVFKPDGTELLFLQCQICGGLAAIDLLGVCASSDQEDK